MAFKFEAPVKLPRWTTEEFQQKKIAYQAKYGSTVHIPGWSDILKWDTTPEPNRDELASYRKKDVKTLGEARFLAIKKLMQKKKENFLRMLSSPTPQIIQNASSIMTTLDDVNDALGTFAVVLRVLAKKLPSMFSKFVTGPAGWILTGAELAGVVQQLTCLPFKARNIQGELNEYTSINPLSKKAKIRRLKKLQSIRISKGEIIEGLQTTENMFGIGLSLGPIVGLLWDIPSGLYKHVKGEKVKVEGAPWPLLWYHKLSSKVMKNAANLWTGLPPEMDEELGKSMVVVNWAAQISRVIMPFFNYQSIGDDIKNILLKFPMPEMRSTVEILEDVLGKREKREGWPFSSHDWIPPTHIFEEGLDLIQENVSNWRERNKKDLVSVVGIQNQMDAGLHTMGALESDDDLELEYDPHTYTMLKLLNQGLRFPCPIDPVQVVCFWENVEKHYSLYGELGYRDAILIAEQLCCFQFHTSMPAP